jgi:ABC-type uncharacterized transport system involved in gliding motility auxiliary subunit
MRLFCLGSRKRRGADANVLGGLVLALAAFALGAALSVYWLRRPEKHAVPTQPVIALSAATKGVLERVTKPVELRYYSILDSSAPAELRQFSDRVKALLAAYQQASSKINVVIVDEPTSTSRDQAVDNGITPFDLEQGEGRYLGVALSSDGAKQAVPRLSPLWEPALEADISRAIERVTAPKPPVPNPNEQSPAPATVEAMKQKIPDFAKTSMEEGERVLRNASLKEFTAAMNETQAEVQAAQLQLQQAQQGASPAQQDAALKHLQDIQNAQSQKLKAIAGQSQMEIEAWKRLKATGP